jgi:hypothetical protein
MPLQVPARLPRVVSTPTEPRPATDLDRTLDRGTYPISYRWQGSTRASTSRRLWRLARLPLNSSRKVGRRVVTVRSEPPDDIAFAEGGLVADHALEVQDHVHVELAVAVVPLPDLHPADERARVPLAEPVHEHPGAFIEHEEVEALSIGLAVPVRLVLDHGRAAIDTAAGPRGTQQGVSARRPSNTMRL